MNAAGPMDDELRLLMRAAQAGDADAYRTLLTILAPRLRRIVGARRAFLGPADAEDVVQDVLLSIHAVLATYDPTRPFFPWVLAILRNRLADAARRYARQRGHEVVVEDIDVTFSDLSTNAVDEGGGDAEALARAIQALPAGQRQAIELLKLREMSLKDASKVTGTSVAALKVATHRAMATLRRALGVTRDHED
jgi:RNA polymerase sigma-70 factor (ECF subfamily)